MSAEALISTAAALVFGALLARWRRRSGHDPASIRWLRRLPTGSVNDDATYWLVGVVALVFAVAR